MVFSTTILRLPADGPAAYYRTRSMPLNNNKENP